METRHGCSSSLQLSWLQQHPTAWSALLQAHNVGKPTRFWRRPASSTPLQARQKRQAYNVWSESLPSPRPSCRCSAAPPPPRMPLLPHRCAASSPPPSKYRASSAACSARAAQCSARRASGAGAGATPPPRCSSWVAAAPAAPRWVDDMSASQQEMACRAQGGVGGEKVNVYKELYFENPNQL